MLNSAVINRQARYGRKMAANVIGKAFRSYKMRNARFKGKTTVTPVFAAKVKKVINKNEEAHHLYTSAQMTAPASGGWYTCSLSTGMSQNDTNTGRQGDMIRFEAIKLAIRLSNLSNTGNSNANIWYRVIIGRFRNLEIATANAFSASNAGVTQGITYANNSSYTGVDGIIDPRFVKVLYDHKVHIQPYYTNGGGLTDAQIETKYLDLTLKLDYDMKYRPGSTDYATSAFKNLYAVVIPYNENGSSDCGTVSLIADLIWKEK